jgi:hypothetical protein
MRIDKLMGGHLRTQLPKQPLKKDGTHTYTRQMRMGSRAESKRKTVQDLGLNLPRPPQANLTRPSSQTTKNDAHVEQQSSQAVQGACVPSQPHELLN